MPADSMCRAASTRARRCSACTSRIRKAVPIAIMHCSCVMTSTDLPAVADTVASVRESGPHRRVLRLEQLPQRHAAFGVARQRGDDAEGGVREAARDLLQAGRQVGEGEELQDRLALPLLLEVR